MSDLLRWLAAPEWAHVVGAFLHSLWQGAVLAIGLAIALRCTGNPVIRYRCGLAALGLLLSAGVVTWAILSAPPNSGSNPFLTETLESSAVIEANVPPAVGLPDKVIVVRQWEEPEGATQWTAWLAGIWLLGAAVMLLRAGIKVAGAEQLRRSCQPLADERMAALVAEACRAVGLARRIRVAVTERLTSPAVVGVLVPTLILPLSVLTTLTPTQIQFVLLHELAHIRRGDYLANLFQLFAEALLFFNPAVWWISNQIRREREACCDALAIQLSGAPTDYAKTLVQVAENILQSAPAAAPAFGGDGREPSSLADRVQRLLVPGYRPTLHLTWRAMLGSLFVGAVILVVSAYGTRNTVGAMISSAQLTTNYPPVSDVSLTTAAEGKPRPPSNVNTTIPVLRDLPLLSGLFTSESQVQREDGKNAFGMNDLMVDNQQQRNHQQFWYRSGDTNVPKQSTDSASVEPLATRTFKVDTGQIYSAFGLALDGTNSLSATNLHNAVRDYFNEAGVNLDPLLGKSTYFNLSRGELWVRATREELDLVEEKLREFTPPLPEFPSRTFRVAPGEIAKLIATVAPQSQAEPDKGIIRVFHTLGVDLLPPKTVRYDDRAGELFVSASAEDLEKVGEILRTLNVEPPQVHLKVHWIEVPADAAPWWNAIKPTNAVAVFGVLSEEQMGSVLRGIKQGNALKLVNEGQVTTVSGRQAQIQIAETRTIVTGVNSNALSSPGNRASDRKGRDYFDTQSVLLGPVIDLLPQVIEDRTRVSLRTIEAATEFVGYAKSSPEVTIDINERKTSVSLPLPRYKVRQTTNECVLLDGQTLALFDFKTKEIIKKPDGEETLETQISDQPNELWVFVTATILDPTGNRVNPPK